jgi:hypothetical protein
VNGIAWSGIEAFSRELAGYCIVVLLPELGFCATSRLSDSRIAIAAKRSMDVFDSGTAGDRRFQDLRGSGMLKSVGMMNFDVSEFHT